MRPQPAPTSEPGKPLPRPLEQMCIACGCSLRTHWADYHWIGCAGALAIAKLKEK